MTGAESDLIENGLSELNRLAAMLDLIALGTENMGPNSNIDAAIDGAADFLRYIGASLNGLTSTAPEARP